MLIDSASFRWLQHTRASACTVAAYLDLGEVRQIESATTTKSANGLVADSVADSPSPLYIIQDNDVLLRLKQRESMHEAIPDVSLSF